MVSRNMLRMIVKEFPTLKITKTGLGITTKDFRVKVMRTPNWGS